MIEDHRRRAVRVLSPEGPVRSVLRPSWRRPPTASAGGDTLTVRPSASHTEDDEPAHTKVILRPLDRDSPSVEGEFRNRWSMTLLADVTASSPGRIRLGPDARRVPCAPLHRTRNIIVSPDFQVGQPLRAVPFRGLLPPVQFLLAGFRRDRLPLRQVDRERTAPAPCRTGRTTRRLGPGGCSVPKGSRRIESSRHPPIIGDLGRLCGPFYPDGRNLCNRTASAIGSPRHRHAE